MKPRKPRRWTLCVADGRWAKALGLKPAGTVGEVWGDRDYQTKHRRGFCFKAPHEHVRVEEILPKKAH